MIVPVNILFKIIHNSYIIYLNFSNPKKKEHYQIHMLTNNNLHSKNWF